MHRNVIKTSNFAYRVLLVRRRISQKIYVAFCVPIGCVRFARYCGKIYRRHFFPCGRLVRIVWKRLQADLKYIYLGKGVRCHYSIHVIIQEYTTGKHSTVLSTSSENFNSDFILIVLTNKFINKLGRAGTKKRR